MKYTSNLPKNKQLLIYMHSAFDGIWIHNASRDGDINDDTVAILKLGIASSRDSLKKMLKALMVNGFTNRIRLCNGDEKWVLTFAGGEEASKLSQEANAVNKWTSIAEMFANEAHRLAEMPSTSEEVEKLRVEVERLREENIELADLNNKLCGREAAVCKENAALKHENDARRKYSIELCEKLDAKTKRCEALEKKLMNIANECNRMASWAENMDLG